MPEIKVHPPLNNNQLNQGLDKLIVEEIRQPEPQELDYPPLNEELKQEVDAQEVDVQKAIVLPPKRQS